MSISVIAGLGNPGPEYQETRHNLGFMVVDALAAAFGCVFKEEKRFCSLVARAVIPEGKCFLVKPLTFMNRSGQALGPFARYHKLPSTAFAVIHDDINLNFGRIKISLKGSAGGHNGVASLLSHLGDGFIRFRIGIGGKPHPEADLSNWVLGKLSTEEKNEFNNKIPDYIEGLKMILRQGPEQTMNQIHSRK